MIITYSLYIQRISSWSCSYNNDSNFNCSVDLSAFCLHGKSLRTKWSSVLVGKWSTCVTPCVFLLASWMSLSSRRVGFLTYSSFMLYKPRKKKKKKKRSALYHPFQISTNCTYTILQNGHQITLQPVWVKKSTVKTYSNTFVIDQRQAQ